MGEPCGITPISSSPTGTWITSETGESSTRFGSYDADFDVYKWDNLKNFCYGEIYLTMGGKVPAFPNQMLLKYKSSNFPVGKILAPSCIAPPPVVDTKKTLTFDNINLELTFDTITGQLFSALAFAQGSAEPVEGGAVVTDIKTSQINMCFPKDDEGGPYCFPLNLQWASGDCQIRGHGSGTCTTTTTYVMGSPYLVTTCTCESIEDCPAGSGYKSCKNGICSTKR